MQAPWHVIQTIVMHILAPAHSLSSLPFQVGACCHVFMQCVSICLPRLHKTGHCVKLICYARAGGVV